MIRATTLRTTINDAFKPVARLAAQRDRDPSDTTALLCMTVPLMLAKRGFSCLVSRGRAGHFHIRITAMLDDDRHFWARAKGGTPFVMLVNARDACLRAVETIEEGKSVEGPPRLCAGPPGSSRIGVWVRAGCA